MAMLELLTQLFFTFAVAIEYYKYPLLGLFAAVALFVSPNKRRFLIALVLAVLLVLVAKELYAEPRPCLTTPGLIDCPAENGFPSAHAAVAVVIALGVLGTPWFYVLGVLAVLTAYSRLYLGVHTPVQVAAGIALGAFVYLLVMEWEKRGKRA